MARRARSGGPVGSVGSAGSSDEEPARSLLAIFASYARLPELRPGEWVQSLFIRAGIPLGIALLYCLAGHRPLEGDPANVAGVLGSVAVAWVLHWYYARWRKGLGEKQLLLVRWAGTFIWLGVLIWLVVRALACMMSLEPQGRYGTWAELSAQYGATVTSAGVWGVLVFVALVRLVGMLWGRWRDKVEPTELFWWIDYLVTFAMRFLWGIVGLSACAAVSTMLTVGSGYEWPFLFVGPWWGGTILFLRQLADSGALGILLAAAVFRIVSARCRLGISVREKHRGVEDSLCIWGMHFLRVAEVLVYGVLAVGLVGSIIALINPVSGLSGSGWALAIAREFLPMALVLPVLGVVALRFAWLGYRRWRDAPLRARSTSKSSKRPFLLRAIVWLGAVAALAGLIFLIGNALRDMMTDVSHGAGPAAIVQMVWSAVAAGLKQPNLWGALAIVVWQIVVLILILIAGIIVLAIVLGADGGGGGGGGSLGGGSAGGGGGGGGSGASVLGGTQTVRDRYGRKLATVEDTGPFGTRVYDRWGRPIGRERASFDGSQRYEINGHDVRVRDSVFGSDKTVSVNGEREGRIRESASGNDPWFDDRWK